MEGFYFDFKTVTLLLYGLLLLTTLLLFLLFYHSFLLSQSDLKINHKYLITTIII